MQRINLISGPRNVSTALMYSFAQRGDTAVVDEPLYAYYLSSQQVEHPGKKEVLESQSHHAKTVIEEVLLADYGHPVLFIKNMAHHIVDMNLDFLSEMTNVFLVREPREMLTSFIKTIPNPTLKDTAYKRQFELFEYVTETKSDPPVVIDSKELLVDPKSVLNEACQQIGIPFDDSMLSWPAGHIPEDGVWAKHWYHNVHKSTGFKPYKPKDEEVPEEFSDLLDACNQYYNKLSPYIIKAQKE